MHVELRRRYKLLFDETSSFLLFFWMWVNIRYGLMPEINTDWLIDCQPMPFAEQNGPLRGYVVSYQQTVDALNGDIQQLRANVTSCTIG